MSIANVALCFVALIWTGLLLLAYIVHAETELWHQYPEQEPERPTENQRHSTGGDSESHVNAPVRVFVEINPAERRQAESRYKQERGERKIDRRVATGTLVVLAIYTAVTTGIFVASMRSANSAKRAATIALRQFKAAEKMEAPHFIVDSVPGAPATLGYGPFSFAISLRNVGKTAALNVAIRWELTVECFCAKLQA